MLIVDSLCLKVIDPNNLLVAVGNQLHYNFTCLKTNQNLTFVLTDLLVERIHGICIESVAPDQHRIVCHGGKEIVQLTLSNQTLTKCHSKTYNLTDWISSAHLYASGSQLALLTFHGVAIRMALEWNGNGGNCIQETIKCPDKSTLYCSLIVDDGQGWSGMRFFGGTAFGQMIVWRISDKQPLLVQRVDCHNGVILSINCNLVRGVLTTTSDDRSMKVWRVEQIHDELLIRPRTTLFGHTGRVFRCKLIDFESKLFACSAGEDQNLCIWNLETGTLLHRQPLGASIWHIDYEAINQIIFVSGSDGNFKQLEIGSILRETKVRCLELGNMPDVFDGGLICKVRFLECGHVAVVTNNNRIYCGKPDTCWSDPVQVPFKISLLETHSNQIAIAGFNTFSVYEYDIKSHKLRLYYTIETMNEMIRSFHFLSNGHYFVCGQSGKASLISQSGEPSLNFQLATSKEPWATAVLDLKELLIVADRTGHLHLFELDKDCVRHRDTIKHIHGRLGCTSLQIDSDFSDDSQETIISAGHDGTLKRTQLNLKTKKLCIRCSINVPIAWIQKILPNNIIAGFNSNNFIVWNQDQRETVVEIECGGGHRYSDLHCANEEYGDFVYLRNKSIKWIRFERPHTLRLLPAPTYNDNNWHSLSCTTVVTMPTIDHSTIMFSGGDDNLLKVHILNNDSHMRNMANIFTHVSSIKTIFVRTIAQGRSWQIFSAGGRAQICVTDVELTPARNVVRVTQVEDFMLRMSDAQRKRLGTSNSIDFNPETRFMSLVVRNSEVFVGCSDGFIRRFAWNSNKIESKSAVFCGKCILRVDLIDGLLVSASTDGNICFWAATDLNSESKPVAVIKHHESGIQSMDWLRIEGTQFQIVTGGDDQRVVLSKFEILDGKQVRLIETSLLNDVHTAQVNGVCFTGDALYSTGVDQTIFRWNCDGKLPRKIVKSCVADIKGICKISSLNGVHEMMVYGHGVQSFKTHDLIMCLGP